MDQHRGIPIHPECKGFVPFSLLAMASDMCFSCRHLTDKNKVFFLREFGPTTDARLIHWFMSRVGFK
jgi:hypothetical protein